MMSALKVVNLLMEIGNVTDEQSEALEIAEIFIEANAYELDHARGLHDDDYEAPYQPNATT